MINQRKERERGTKKKNDVRMTRDGLARGRWRTNVPECLSLHKVFDFALGKGPRDDEFLPCRNGVVELRADKVVSDFENVGLRCCRRGAAGRRRWASFHQTWTQVPGGRVLGTQAYAGLDFLQAQKKWTIIRTTQGRRAWRGLTMEGVRRSSCRPRPARMTVLLVSMMTTLESRKPMLLIAHERERTTGWPTWTGLGFPWRMADTQASTNNALAGLAPRRIYFELLVFFSLAETHSLRWNGRHNFLMATLAGHTLPRGNFISFGIATFISRVSSAYVRRDML